MIPSRASWYQQTFGTLSFTQPRWHISLVFCRRATSKSSHGDPGYFPSTASCCVPLLRTVLGRQLQIHKIVSPPRHLPSRPSTISIPQMTLSVPVCTFQIPLLNSHYRRELVSEKTSWQALLTLDRKSDDFTHLARRLLSDQRTRKAEASQFPEEEALKLIELIEQTVCLTFPVSHDSEQM